MARTKTAPQTAETVPEPDTEATARPSPVLAWPSEWPVPELPVQDKRRAARGLPMAPVIAGAGNTTALTATAAYSAGGPAAAAAAGVVIAAGATAAVLRRRATVRRTVATRAGGATTPRATRSAGGGGARSGGGARGRRSGSGSGSRSGSGRSGNRGGTLRRSGGGATRGGRHGATGSGGGGRRSGRHTGSGALGATLREQRRTDRAAERNHRPGGGRGHALRAAAGRATRAAYRAGRPLVTGTVRAAARTARGLANAARVVGHHARPIARAVWDGARAGLVGVAAALWQRRARVFWPAVRAMWRRIKNKRAAAEAPADPTPAVADTVRRPAGTSPTTPTGGTAMSGGGHHFVAPAMELARAAAAYSPRGMLEVGADFAGLEEGLRLHAEAMKTTVENADANFPLHPNIVELMRQIHALQLKAAELAGELSPAFRSLHDVDLARLENPRKGVEGERMWDVSANL